MSQLEAYAATETHSQNELIEKYVPLVKRIAYHLAGRLPASVQPDDLVQAGLIGLLEASRNYDPSHGANFETYAGIRARGAMIDEIRRSDWAPRSVHRKVRSVSDAMQRVESRTFRDARDAEVAEEMGVSLDEYYDIVRDINGHKVVGFEDIGIDNEILDHGMYDSTDDPQQNLNSRDIQNAVTDAIAGLPERDRLVMSLYYDEELNLREIGEVLGVSESRVCQIHGQAIARLRSRLTRDD